MMLDGTGAVYRHLDPLREGQCGTPAPIELTSFGANPPVVIEPPARVTCGLAATLSAWSDLYLQQIARAHFDEPITAIRNVASYVCRNRYDSPDKPISEHARANALDVAAFKTQSGRWITVLDNWALPHSEQTGAQDELVHGVTQSLSGPGPERLATKAGEPNEKASEPDEKPEKKPETAFLHELHITACTLFGTVLGPYANDAHKDHFHVDLAERRHGNYCE
jgi:hypothetical protein